MNYWTLILISITLCLQGCKAQSKIMENQNNFIPAIDNSFEKFDIKEFEVKKDSISKKYIISNEVFYQEAEKQSLGYIRRTYYNKSYFMMVKKFFDNGNIQEKAISFNNGYPIGIWYEFDEAGNLIREIDTDRGYDFGWKEILSYCGQHKITLAQGYETSGFQTTIYKEESASGANIWVITHQVSGDQLEEITLDGKTGTVLGKKQIEFVNH